MKKGFTLIELMGVIVILGVLSAVIIPKIGDGITVSKNKSYQVQVESIKKGVYDFLIDNESVMRNNDSITLTLGVIKQGGYLPVDIKNPITKKSFSNESNINITKLNGKFDIELNLLDVENYNESVNSNSPILVLNGDYIEYVDVFGEYNELGATAIDYNGEILAVDAPQYFLEDEVFSIDTSTLSTYIAIYTVVDSEGNRSSATRTIVVRDNEPPVITVPSYTTINVSQVPGYDLEENVSVSDNFDTSISILDVSITSELASRVGKYVVTYEVSDSNNNSTTVRRIINVE